MSKPEVTPDFTADPHWGKGGRYIIDADGNRVPAPAEDEAAPLSAPVPAPAADAAPAADQPAPKRGK